MMMKKSLPPACAFLLVLGLIGIALADRADAAPQISVADPVELELNGDATQAFSIDVENTGDSGDLTVSAAAFDADPNFSVASLPAPIAPGGSGAIGILFKPLGAGGNFSATLSIDSDDTANPNISTTVRGTIHDPMLIAPAMVDIGDSPSYTITIGNGGETQELTVQSISMSGDISFFELRRFPLRFFPIPAGGTGEIEFDFNPGERKGIFNLQMRVFTDDPVTRPFIIEIVAEVGFDSTLVAWWPLDGDTSDASGNGHDGTLVGAPAASAGVNNFTAGALDFDGAGTRIDVPYSSELNPDDFTVTLWARPHGAIAGQLTSPFANRDESPGPLNHGFSLNLNDGAWDFWTGDGDASWDVLTGPLATSTDRWWHLAITYDSASDLKNLYVDGELAASDTGVGQYVKNGSVENEDLHIGAGQDDGLGAFFDGELDDVALFRVALSQAEIQTIADGGVARFIAADRPFQITQVQPSAPGDAITILWNSGVQTNYAIDRSTDLNAVWQEIEESTASTGTVTAYTDNDLPASEGRVFYRVRLAE